MAETQTSSYQPGVGLNDVFSEITNCELINPPINEGFTDQNRQFLKKRDGYGEFMHLSGTIVDFIYSGGYFYVLEETATNTCRLIKVGPDSGGGYSVITVLRTGIPYLSTYAKGTVKLSYPSGTKLVSGATCDNLTASTIELLDNDVTFNIGYIGAYGVITSHNEASVKDKDLTAPPVGPVDGDRYIVATGATGAWNGKDKQIAQYSAAGAGWNFTVPANGWFVYVEDESTYYRYNGTAWSSSSTSTGWKEDTIFDIKSFTNIHTLGINSPISISNIDSYDIYPSKIDYYVFKRTGNSTTGKVGVDVSTDTVKVFTNLAGIKDMVIQDNVLFLTNGTSVLQKYSGQSTGSSYENTYPIRDTNILSIDNGGDFILVNGDSKIYGLFKTIESTLGTTIYTLREIANQGIFSQKSYLIYSSNIYLILQDKHRYALNVTINTNNNIAIKLPDSGYKVQGYLDKLVLNSDQVDGYWYQGNYGFFIHGGASKGTIRYNENLQAFLIDTHAYGFANFQQYEGNLYCSYADKILLKGGKKDIDQDVPQKIVMIGPAGYIGNMFNLLCMNMVIGYIGDPISGDVTLEMGGGCAWKNALSLTTDGTCVTQTVNSISGDGVLGLNLLGMINLGSGTVNYSDYLSKMYTLQFKVGKSSQYAKVIIESNEANSIVFGKLDMIYNAYSPLLVPIKNVK